MSIIGIGYAYLLTQSNISGTTNVSANTWSIYWDHIHITDGFVALNAAYAGNPNNPGGGGATINTSNEKYRLGNDSIYFKYNLQIIQQLFDLDVDCQYDSIDDFESYECQNDSVGYALIDNRGQTVIVDTDYYGCACLVDYMNDEHETPYYMTMCGYGGGEE